MGHLLSLPFRALAGFFEISVMGALGYIVGVIGFVLIPGRLQAGAADQGAEAGRARDRGHPRDVRRWRRAGHRVRRHGRNGWRARGLDPRSRDRAAERVPRRDRSPRITDAPPAFWDELGDARVAADPNPIVEMSKARMVIQEVDGSLTEMRPIDPRRLADLVRQLDP